MNVESTFQVIIDALNHAAIPHMLAGSFASSLHGLARTTADIDLVIAPGPRAVERFISTLDRDRFYVDESAAVRSVQRQDQFNVIDTGTGWKVDLVIRKDRPFSRAEFDRRIPAWIMGTTVPVASVEDTVLSKLEWSKLGGSERQIEDVIDVLQIQTNVDDFYLDRWARELDVADLLEQARQSARHRSG